MLGDSRSRNQALLNETQLTWTTTGANKMDTNAEAGWTLLPNQDLLVVDAYAVPWSEVYNPGSGSWSFAGDTPSILVDSVHEIGPQLLMTNGSVFVCGAFASAGVPAHSALYSSSGTWTSGPDLPMTSDGLVDCADAPAALLPNGRALIATGPGYAQPGVHYFEFDGTTFTEMPTTSHASRARSEDVHFLILPTGQIFMTDHTHGAELYQSTGKPLPSWAPVVAGWPGNVPRGQLLDVSGTGFNGLSQGAAFGDDAQMATNYPLVRITNNATHHVFYAMTSGHSTMAVATGSAFVGTDFEASASTETGLSTLVVIANGIASAPVSILVL
jgi:hypothetical protein